MMEPFIFKTSMHRLHKSYFVEIYLLILLVAFLLCRIYIIPIFVILSVLYIFTTIFLYIKERRKAFELIVFKQVFIEIEQTNPLKIDYINIDNMKITFRAIKGDHAKVLTMTGHENTIRIVTKGGQKIIKDLWCETSADYLRLKSLGVFLKEQGINIVMKGFLL